MRIQSFFLSITACCAVVASARAARAGALDGVSAEAQTGDELHFIRPADLERGRLVTLVLTNPTKEPIRATLELGIKDRSNAPTAWKPQGQVGIAPGGSVSRTLDLAIIGPRLGVRYIDWRLRADGESASGHTSFAVVDPVGVTPGVKPGEFIFGNAGVRGYWNLALKERIVRTATIVGAESLRSGSDWRKLEPEQGQYEWKGEDEVVALAEKYGAQIQYLIGFGGAPWTKSPETLALAKADDDLDGQWHYAPRLDAWRDWTRVMAERYKGRVRYYEIWNEPDIGFFKGTARQYVDLLKSASSELKAVDPSNVVLTGGFASMDHRSHNKELFELTLTEGQPYFDLLAYHRHGGFDILQKQVDDQLLPVMRKLDVTQPLYFNETAMGRDYAREWDQAVDLPKRLAFVWSRGARGYHYFTTWTRQGDTSSAAAYSMVNWDFTPRPVWVAYNEMSRVLRGRQFAGQLDLGPGRWGFTFRGQGAFTGQDARSYALLAWSEDKALADAPVVLRVGARAKARLVDLMGNSTPLAVEGGRVIFTVQREPRYLVIENGDAPPQNQGALLQAERAGAVVPGGAQIVSVELRNPLDTPQKVSLQWQVPAPLRALSPLRVEQRIAAGGRGTANLRVALPDGTGAGRGTPDVVALYQVGRGELKARTAIPVPLGVAIGAGDFEARPADFTLESASDVVNTNDIDPATMHLTWKGPGDLSARAWLGRRAGGVAMRFVVRDDVARQPYSGAEMWRGDSVQIGLAVPGQNGDFEVGLSRSDGGASQVTLWNAPQNFRANEIAARVQLQTRREGDLTLYDAFLPFEAFGLNEALLRAGVRWSFVVNDLDEAGQGTREGYIQLTPGIAGDKDPSRFPVVVFPQ